MTDVQCDVWCSVQSFRAGLADRALKVNRFVALGRCFSLQFQGFFFFFSFLIHSPAKGPETNFCSLLYSYLLYSNFYVSKALCWFSCELCLGNTSLFCSWSECTIMIVAGQKNKYMSASPDTQTVAAAGRQTTSIPMCFGKYVFSVEKRRSVGAYFLPATPLSPIARLQTGGLIASPYLPDAS